MKSLVDHILPVKVSSDNLILSKFSLYNFNITLLIVVLFSCLTFGQNVKSTIQQSKDSQRSSMILNLSEQVKWPNIDNFTTFNIGVLATSNIANNLLKTSANRRIYNKLIDVKKINELENVLSYHVLYVSATYEYLLKDILTKAEGNNILVITEGYPVNSAMINMVYVEDSYSYNINRMHFRKANLTLSRTLASYAVTPKEIDDNLFKKTEEKLSIVSKENDKQKEIIKNQIKTIGTQIDYLNEKNEALIEKEDSITSLFLEGEQMSKRITEKINKERLNEQKIAEQINQIKFQNDKINAINKKIEDQQKILKVQTQNIYEKTTILENKNIIIDTQRKYNTILSILSTLLFIACVSLLIAYTNIKKLTYCLKSQHKEINKQSKQLNSKNKELEQFAYITSHDLQEPLNTISSFIDILKEEYASKFDEEGKQMMGFVKEGSVRMKKLIDALLQYSRLGRNNIYANVDCLTLMDALTLDLQSVIKSTNAEITYENLPTIRGNEVELRLLFQNLITNGIKFRALNTTPKILITCKKVVEEGEGLNNNQTNWVFAVKDNGIGIAEEYQNKVFAIFQRLHSRLDYEGSGIGLAHCKKIVEAHSGKIWFTSQKNEGTIFYFSIPTNI